MTPRRPIPFFYFLMAIWTCTAQVEPKAFYHLKNGAHLSFLNVSGDAVGDLVIHTTDDANGRAEWQLIDTGNGFFQIQNVKNKLFIANLGNLDMNAPLKLVANPGGGALWSISGNPSTKFLLKNKISGYFLSSGGNRYQNAPMVQASESQYSYWDLIKTRGGSVGNQSAVKTDSQPATVVRVQPTKINWQETPLPSKYFGVWRIYATNASRNDVAINSQYVKDGMMNQKIIASYYYDGVYKIITTYNNYFASYFIKDRVGGIGDGGIYINSTVAQAFRTQEEAFAMGIPDKFDSGFR